MHLAIAHLWSRIRSSWKKDLLTKIIEPTRMWSPHLRAQTRELSYYYLFHADIRSEEPIEGHCAGIIKLRIRFEGTTKGIATFDQRQVYSLPDSVNIRRKLKTQKFLMASALPYLFYEKMYQLGIWASCIKTWYMELQTLRFAPGWTRVGTHLLVAIGWAIVLLLQKTGFSHTIGLMARFTYLKWNTRVK